VKGHAFAGFGRIRTFTIVGVIGAAALLAGCSSNLLGGKSHVQQASNVPVGNELALPPDLQLRAPGASTTAYQPNPAPAPEAAPPSLAEEGDVYGGGQVAAAQPSGDVYAQYGISKTKPDGTPKKDWELRAELKQAIQAKKRQENPNYGTFLNVGGLFKDE
jgi:hypothetical protein